MAQANFIETKKAIDDITLAIDAQITKANELNSKVVALNTSYAKVPSEYLKTQKDIATATDNITKSEKQLQAEVNKAIALKKKEVQAILDQSKAIQALEKQKNTAIATLSKEEAAAAKAENAYERVKAKIASMLPTYNDLKTKVELGIKLTAKEEASLSLLEKRMIKYREVLNSVNKGYGNFSLEVGNYAKANSNLSNSIGQISRELPNFGQSFSIGVLSLTNNVGALIDSVKQVKAQNKELQAQGQATKSVFSQVLSSVFSWQTALFIGIGIFSAYSKEIGEWVSSLWSANSALKANERALVDAYDARMRYSGATSESTKQTQKELTEFILLINGMKDLKKSQEERLNMAKRFKDAYPGYLKNFTEEQIMAYSSGKANSELSKTMVQLTNDIKERNLALAESEEASKTFSLMNDLKQEFEFREAQNKLINKSTKDVREFIKKRAEDRIDLMNDSEDFVNKFGKVTVNDLGNYSTVEISTLKTRYNALVKEFNAERAAINQKLVNTSLLDFKEDKSQKNKKAQKEKLALTFSAIKAEAEYQKAILEREKTEENYRMNDDKAQLDARLDARKEYSRKVIELLNIEIKEENDLNLEKFTSDLEKNKVRYENDLKDAGTNSKLKLEAQKQYLENVSVLNRRYHAETEKTDIVAYTKMQSLLTEDADFYKKIEEKKIGYSQEADKIVLDGRKDYFKTLADDERKTLAIRQKSFEQFIEISKKELEVQEQIDLAKATSEEERGAIIQKYFEAYYKLSQIKSPFQVANEGLKDYLKTLTNGFADKALEAIGITSAKVFFDIEKNGKSAFQNLLDAAKPGLEKLAVSFQAVGDVVQDVYNKMAEASNQRYENEIANLEKQKNISIAFAGEDDAAKAEIERQYEIRKKDIARKEFKAKQEQAKVNIIIDTAQAVVEALPNYVLAGAVAALGLVELAIVSSQKAPEYWQGTDNHPGGWMKINDRGLGAELVTTPDGKSRIYSGKDVMVNAPKGTKVKTASETIDYLMFNNDLNSILTSNNISSPIIDINNSGISDNQVNKIVSAIENKAEFSQLISNGQLKTVIRKGNTETEIMNRRVNFKGMKV